MEDKMIEKVEHQSKVVSLKIENFMSIKNALLEFDDSNIISLCGYNDSGKSAVTRLLEVMFYNAYSTDQVKFITDEEAYWLGELTFSDGVVYTRIKYADGKSLWELKKSGILVFTNRLPNGSLAAMGDTPDAIEKYLGVIQDVLTGEELNVRRNLDKLFLINTSGGDNYKILNSVLRSDVISSASKNLNDDKNKLTSEVNEQTVKKDVLTNQYNDIDVAPVFELAYLDQFIGDLVGSRDELLRISAIMEECNKINDICIYDELASVDTSRLVELQNVLDLKSASSVSIYDVVNPVELSRLQSLREIIALNSQLQVSSYSELVPVELEQVNSIKTLCELYNAYKGTEISYISVNDRLTTKKNELLKLSIEHDLKVCKNCGSVVD